MMSVEKDLLENVKFAAILTIIRYSSKNDLKDFEQQKKNKKQYFYIFLKILSWKKLKKNYKAPKFNMAA
jgi:hypothetical protein